MSNYLFGKSNKMKTNNLHYWLKKYSAYQDNIQLCSRESTTTWWGNRVNFLDEDYNDQKYPFYNHRAVLDNEVVIEYDTPNKDFNLALIRTVEQQLDKDGIKYSLWFSGGKSYHCHVIFNKKNASRLSLLKKSIVRHYGTLYFSAKSNIISWKEYEQLEDNDKEKYVKMIPDLRLCDNNHLVRAEYGLHEESGNHKRLVRMSPCYGDEENELPVGVWQYYSNKLTTVIKRQVSIGISEVMDSEEVKLLLSTTNFKQYGDGKKRALFILINLLKKNHYNPNGKYDSKEELIDFLWDWYKYVGGYQNNKIDISRMVGYYWNRDYSRMGVGYIREVLEDIGVKK